jgi:hypothetical protein
MGRDENFDRMTGWNRMNKITSFFVVENRGKGWGFCKRKHLVDPDNPVIRSKFSTELQDKTG